VWSDFRWHLNAASCRYVPKELHNNPSDALLQNTQNCMLTCDLTSAFLINLIDSLSLLYSAIFSMSYSTTNKRKSNANAPRRRGSKSDAAYFTFRCIPPIGYTIQNIIISIGTMTSSFAALCFTVSFVLPLSILRRSVPARTLSLAATASKDFKVDEVLNRGKVVLVVGVTCEMGYDIIMQYANDKGTTIIGLAQTAGESPFLGRIYAGFLIVYVHIPCGRSVYVFHLSPCR